MSTMIEAGPNADLVNKLATRVDLHRVRWETMARSAEARIDKAFADLEEEALAIFRADDKPPQRWRHLPANLGHLLDLASGIAESRIAAAELDLVRARRVLRNIERGES